MGDRISSGERMQCLVCRINRHGGPTGTDAVLVKVRGFTVHASCGAEIHHAFASQSRIKLDGEVVRWRSNGRVPIRGQVALWTALGLMSERQAVATEMERHGSVARSAVDHGPGGFFA
jgi:hypothetical protein